MMQRSRQDERITAQHRKVSSEAYGILMLVLLASILVQQFLFNAPFEQYAVEFVCFFGMSVYMIIRYLTLGLNIFGEGKRAKSIPLVNSIVTGLAVTAVNGVLDYTRYAQRYQADGFGYFFAMLAITFISATIFTFALVSFIGCLNKKKQEKIQRQLDEKELGD